MAATASQSNLSGLPRRLVQDGIVTEEVIQEAQEAARKEKMALVAYLVANEKADSRAIAVAASHEFGVPLLDLDAIEIELEVGHVQGSVGRHHACTSPEIGSR